MTDMPSNIVELAAARKQRQQQRNENEAEAVAAGLEFIKSKNGEIKPLMANVDLLLSADERWDGVLAYNEFAQTVTVLKSPPYADDQAVNAQYPRIIRDSDIVGTTVWVQRNGIAANKDSVADAIKFVSEKHRYNPVQDYLNSLVWDGAKRLDNMDSDFFRALSIEPDYYNTSVIKLFLIGAVARAFEPGCKMDFMLILEGDQSVGKTRLVEAMFGEYCSADLGDLTNKDTFLNLQGSWGVEVAELDAFNRADTSKIKAFVSKRSDRFRAPYDRTAQDYPRSNVFIGTVNPGANGYLRDETGGRRFWPIAIRSKIDIDAIKTMRDQIWAEAVAAYKAGQPWHIIDSRLEQAAAAEQADRQEVDPWEDVVLDWIAGKGMVTSAEILQAALNVQLAHQDRRSQMRVGAILTRAGWIKFKQRIDGVPKWVYVPPARD
jgi:putative DNA primase/helicase